MKPLNVIFPNDELYPKKTLAEWKSLMVNASDMPSSQGQSLTTVGESNQILQFLMEVIYIYLIMNLNYSWD